MHNRVNETRVFSIIGKYLPHLRFLPYCKDLNGILCNEDGLYVVRDMPVPREWAIRKGINEFNPKYREEQILTFLANRFWDYSYEYDFRARIDRYKQCPSARQLDFVIVEVKGHKAKKIVTLEVASEDHFEGDTALAKTVSDCLKACGTITKTHIIDARKNKLHTLESQVFDALKTILK